jgi:hypothetical protein
LDATSVGLILSDSCTQFDNAKQERIVRLEIRGVQFFVRSQDVELGGVHADVQKADTKLAMPDKVELGLARGC